MVTEKVEESLKKIKDKSSYEANLKEIIEKYPTELYFKNFEGRYREWINNLEEESDKTILRELFFNLKFFSRTEIKSLLKEKLLTLKKVNQEYKTTAFIPLTPVNGRHSGSNDIMAIIKEIDREEQMEGSRLFPYRDSILTDINYSREFNTLFFVDDISGTGGTIEKFIKEHQELMMNKNVIILFLVVTNEAIDKFESIKNLYREIKFEFVYCHITQKISSQNYLSEEEYKRLIDIEEGLWGEGNKNILGYEGSELLILFSHNIPNNTVSSFWYNSIKWNRLFARITAPNRKMQNYKNKKRNQ